MHQAGVNFVNLGIFSWAQVQPAEDAWNWGWMDEILDLLHAGGIAVDLGTGTSSPPPWLSTAHPEILMVTADGTTISPGGRQHYRPVLAGLPPLCHVARADDGGAVRAAPGPVHVARVQRARLPQPHTTTPTTPRLPSAPGWRPSTAASMRSTARGARRSGRSATRPGTRSCRHGSTPASPTPRRVSTSSASRPGSCRTTCARSRPSCARSPPTCRSRPTSWSWPAGSTAWTMPRGQAMSTS